MKISYRGCRKQDGWQPGKSATLMRTNMLALLCKAMEGYPRTPMLHHRPLQQQQRYSWEIKEGKTRINIISKRYISTFSLHCEQCGKQSKKAPLDTFRRETIQVSSECFFLTFHPHLSLPHFFMLRAAYSPTNQKERGLQGSWFDIIK